MEKMVLNRLIISRFILYSTIYLISFVLFIPAASGMDSVDDKRFHILLLNAYHKGYLWTDEITRGVEETVLHSLAEIHIEYMDTKRQFNDTYLSLLSSLMAEKHRKHHYDLIIVSDNNAYNFIIDQGKNIFREIPIVFCGLNYFRKEQLQGRTNITGVNEQADLEANLDLIQRIHPDFQKIVIVTDNTATGQRIQEESNRIRVKPEWQDKIDMVYNLSHTELTEKLNSLSKGTYVLFTFFFRDKNNVFFEYDQATKLVTDASSVPVYGAWNFSFGLGIVGGYLTSGYDQGVAAAEMALTILSGTGTPPNQIPIIWKSPTRLKFDYRQMKRFDIPVDRIPPHAKTFFRPVSFYHKYKMMIWQICFVFLTMCITIAGLSYGLARARRSAEKLKRSTNFIRALIDAVPTAVFYKDREGRYQGCNQIFTDIVGKTSKEIRGKTMHELWPSEDTHAIHEKDLKLMNHPENQMYEFVIKDKNENLREVIITKDVFRDEAGEVKGLVGAFLDITKRKKAEQELKRLQNYLSNIIDSMPSVLVAVDTDGNISQWNQTAAIKTGISAKKAIGRNILDVFPSLSRWMDMVRKSIQTQEPIQDQKRAVTIDNRTLYEDITIYPLSTKGVEGAVIRIDDVSEQVRLEEVMVQSEKILSVGGLAAGMAHEINNPLAGIIQTANVMKSRLSETQIPANQKAADEIGISLEDIRLFMEKRDIFNMMDAVTESSRRVAEIVENMLSFARKSDSIESSHNPVELMDKIIDLAGTDYDLKRHYDFKTIKIVKEYQKNLPMLVCEGAKLQQVFLNILSNGAHAMQESNDNAKAPCFIIRMFREAEQDMLNIQIEDNGPGMDESVRKRIFEPFFTTKPPGIGTGLGLSVSYFIVTQNHRGTMEVESSLGKGSCFTIRLPLGG